MRADRVLALVAATVALASGGTLLAMLYRSPAAGERLSVGYLERVRNQAQQQLRRSGQFHTLRREALIYNGDTIRTAVRSHAVVRLKDGTRIRMDELSMFILEVGPRHIRLDLKRGTLRIRRGKSERKFELRSPSGTVRLQAGEVEVGRDGKKVRLLSGSAVVLERSSSGRVVQRVLKAGPQTGKPDGSPESEAAASGSGGRTARFEARFQTPFQITAPKKRKSGTQVLLRRKTKKQPKDLPPPSVIGAEVEPKSGGR